MINKQTPILLLAFFVLVNFQIRVCAQQTNKLQTTVYKLDIQKSKLLWQSPKSVSKHNGFILFNSGSLQYSSAGQPILGTFSLNMNSVKAIEGSPAENEKVRSELISEMFFEVATYPTATINITKMVAGKEAGTYTVTADLTIKGITHPIGFVANIKRSGTIVTAVADIKIDRKKWNIHHKPANLFDSPTNYFAAVKDEFIADEIPVTVRLVFNK